MRENLLIYTPLLSPRVHYIMGLIFRDLLGVAYQITADVEQYHAFDGAKLFYHTNSPTGKLEVHIAPAGLLTEKSINSHQLRFIDYEGSKAFFPVYAKSADMPFDPFSAAFYLVSRYEEYLPYLKDEHGRFSPDAGIAVQQGFLQVALVNRWALKLGEILKLKFPTLIFNYPRYQFVPTIDIDAAWAYKHKGLIRTLGGYLKDISSGNIAEAKKRTRVLLGLDKDPFDTFDFLYDIHQKYGLRPIFFILFAAYSQNDKNTPTGNLPFRRLLKSLADHAFVGIHPSYASNGSLTLLKSEIDGLSAVLRREITASRQHFLKISFPETYRNLINLDITDDYSLGFAGKPGFRAGICSPFKWYNLEAETETSLTLHPFALMEGTLRDYMNVGPEQAMDFIRPLVDEVKSVNGCFISLWHNESMSEEKRWIGWTRVYSDLVGYASP
ncbi:polysaccharide deacetylase family protein [Lentimicrobium sp.]|uniref:polysaccharide deacetylase family protein n=1 Tax=Lentimicrobium sp. TaxID=2034841 RepID=UPI002BEAB7BF|nr:polysaccharide deacetylase family protein [Lentimicrobium sp.]HPJ63060.1 polysaccharide deacetylase family protein [Lentimicrobium sp.]